MTHPGLPHPYFLEAFLEAFIRTGGFNTEGIFRISANGADVNRVKDQIENESQRKYQIPTSNPHVVSNLLKQWIRSLPEPLVPNDYYSQATQLKSVEDSLDIILTKIPSINANVVLFLVQLMQRLSSPPLLESTKMTASNLAVVFSPLLLRCPTVDPVVIIKTAEFEQQFLKNLIAHMEFEDHEETEDPFEQLDALAELEL